MSERSTAPRHLYGVLGSPLAQSLSPALFTWAFARLDWPGAYFAWEKEAHELSAFFRSVRSLPIQGLSVTVPHKEAVILFMDDLTARAKRVGAVNTVFWQAKKLVGDNTDVAGFLAPLAGRELPETAFVLGAGGAARAILAGLAERGLDRVSVAARSRARAEALAEDFNCEVVAWEERMVHALGLESGLLVNATPLGMKGKAEDQSPLPEETFARLAAKAGDEINDFIVYDAVYNPAGTRLLREAAAHGLNIVDGLGFFAAQALAQLERWTGKKLPADELRAYVGRLLSSQG